MIALRLARLEDLTAIEALIARSAHRALGFELTERFALRLPDGVEVLVAHMARRTDD